MQNIPSFKTRHNVFKKCFFLSAITQWNNLDLNIRNSSSLNVFRNSILKSIRSSANSVFNSHNPKAIKFITRLWLVLCHLREHKFKHSFQDLLNPISNFEPDIELSLRYLRHYPTYNSERHTLLSTLKSIDNNLLDLTKPILTTTLLFGSNSFDINTNTNILNVTMNLVYLLKDLTNHFFNEFTDCYQDKVFHKKLNKSVSVWVVKRLSFSVYYFSLFFLRSKIIFFFYSQRLLVYFGAWWSSILLLQCTRFIWFVYKTMNHY